MKKILKKFSSRKFLACVAGVVSGIAFALNADAALINQISGIVLTTISIVSYIVVEGHIDNKAITQMTELFQEIAEIDDAE